MSIYWEIRLLGRLALYRRGTTLESAPPSILRFRTEKTASLLAFLASPVGRVHTREVLCERFWPEAASPQAARACLRTSLASLRRQLEPPGVARHSVLETLGNSAVRLRPEAVQTDVMALEAALRRGDTVHAKALALSPFLEGNYDDWAQQERERLERLLSALEPSEPHLPPTSPPPPSREPIPSALTKLPPRTSRSFGHLATQAQILQALQERRLVTLTGPGGSGKTRLALEVAYQLAHSLPPSQAIYFVPLAETRTPERLLPIVRETLGLPPSSLPLLDATVQQLQQLPPLYLILDNLEQLLPQAASLLQELLQRVTTLRLLVTSRRRLALREESLLQVPFLPLPDPSTQELASLAQNPAIALLIDRAQQVRPDFQLTRQNREALVQLCHKLEGLPLALELAAAWLGVLSPQQLLAQLPQHLAAVVPRARQQGRHRSLWETIAWSYALLPPELQSAFRRLAIFRGEWTAAAAATLCGLEAPLETLARLRERSLLELRGEQFYMLEPLREFGMSLHSPDEYRALLAQHAQVFLQTVQRRARATGEDTQPYETADLHATLEFFLTEPEGAAPLLYLTGWLYYHWWRRGLWDSWAFWVEKALARRAELSPSRSLFEQEALVRALQSAGNLAHYRAQYQAALGYFHEALAVCDAPELSVLRLSLLSQQLQSSTYRGDLATAEALAGPLLADLRQVPPHPYNTSIYATAASAVAELARRQGELDRAEALNDEANAAWETISTGGGGSAQVTAWQGRTALLRGDYTRALALYNEALTALGEHSARQYELRLERGRVLVALDRPTEARQDFHEGLQVARRLNSRFNLYRLLGFVAELLGREGDLPGVALVLGTLAAQRSELDLLSYPQEQAGEARLREQVQAVLGRAQTNRLEAKGATLSLDQAFQRAGL